MNLLSLSRITFSIRYYLSRYYKTAIIHLVVNFVAFVISLFLVGGNLPNAMTALVEESYYLLRYQGFFAVYFKLLFGFLSAVLLMFACSCVKYAYYCALLCSLLRGVALAIIAVNLWFCLGIASLILLLFCYLILNLVYVYVNIFCHIVAQDYYSCSIRCDIRYFLKYYLFLLLTIIVLTLVVVLLIFLLIRTII